MEQIRSNPTVERVLNFVLTLCSNESYSALLSTLSPYLCSNSPPQEVAACLLLDLSTGPLAPYLSSVLVRVSALIEILMESGQVLLNARREKAKANALVLFLQSVSFSALPQIRFISTTSDRKDAS